jgi:hypothetical protein
MLTMGALQHGSLKAAPSATGKSPGLCCGSTEKVHPPALCAFALNDRLLVTQRALAKPF